MANAMSPASRLESSFNKDVFYNDVEVRIKLAGDAGQPLKTVLTAAVLLVTHSPKFETQLANWQPTQPTDVRDTEQHPNEQKDRCECVAAAVSYPRRVAELMVEDLPEADVAELCLRFAHTSMLPVAASSTQLLRLYHMADYIDMQACCAAVVEALIAANAPDVSVHDAIGIAYGSILPGHVVTQKLKAVCIKALLHHLGDVVVVMRSKELKAQWMSLPHAALLELLHSDQLRTDSEDSVMTAVSCWADSNECNVTAKQELLQSVRLSQLSSTYFYTVLPALKWLQEGQLLGSAIWRLAGHVAANPQLKAAGMFNLLQHGSHMPHPWTFPTPRPTTRGNHEGSTLAVLHNACVTRKRLEEELLPRLMAIQGNLTNEAAEALFAHGFNVHPRITINKSGELGLYAVASLPSLCTPGCEQPLWHFRLSVLCQQSCDEVGKYSLSIGRYDGAGKHAGHWGHPRVLTFPANMPITDIASWDTLLLKDGALQLKLLVQPSKDCLTLAAAADAASSGRQR